MYLGWANGCLQVEKLWGEGGDGGGGGAGLVRRLGWHALELRAVVERVSEGDAEAGGGQFPGGQAAPIVHSAVVWFQVG
jgi:hypothetical protein